MIPQGLIIISCALLRYELCNPAWPSSQLHLSLWSGFFKEKKIMACMDDEVWYVLDTGRLQTISINPWTCCLLISSRKFPGSLYFFLAKSVIQSSLLDFSQSIATSPSLLSIDCCAMLVFSLIYVRLQFTLFFLHLTRFHLHLNSMEDSSGCLAWFLFVIFFFTEYFAGVLYHLSFLFH